MVTQSTETVKGVTQDIGQASKITTTQLISVLERMKDTVQDTSTRTGQMGATFEMQMRDAVQGMTDVLARLQRQNEEVASLLQNSSREATQRAVDEMTRASDVLRQQLVSIAEKTEDAARQMQSAGRSVAEAATPLSSLGENLLGATTSIKEMQQGTVETMRTLSGSLDGSARELTTRMQSTADAASNAWESYRARFEEVDDDLKKVVRDIVEQISSNQAQMLSYVTQVDSELGKAVRTLGGGIESLAEAADDIRDVSEKLVQERRFGASRSGMIG
jgi:predicted  nucleic acid-binding Zn-ribbon protein